MVIECSSEQEIDILEFMLRAAKGEIIEEREDIAQKIEDIK